MFFHHPRLTTYDFGQTHPLRPERLIRSAALLSLAAPDLRAVDPAPATESDVLRVHRASYLEVVRQASEGRPVPRPVLLEHGLGTSDTPVFEGMFEAGLAYAGATLRAAEAVRDGEPVAVTFGGGLHHAHPARASGFCVFNDVAIAILTLRERFERVAYVDIDLHHGDGVQAVFYEDPTVLTFSVHQDGRTLFPGTGFPHEEGSGGTAWNLPLPPGTTGDVWSEATVEALRLAFERFRPQAVVLQSGSDAHFLDPLGSLMVTAQEWAVPVRWLKEQGLPIVCCGGGGYGLTAVPRMWAAAALTLLGRKIVDIDWGQLPREWGLHGWWDDHLPWPRGAGREAADDALRALRSRT
jgi:acetoin utilization protein AcuC